MESLELIVAVAAAVPGAGRLARRTGPSGPLLLLGAGCLMGLTAPFDAITLAPEVVHAFGAAEEGAVDDRAGDQVPLALLRPPLFGAGCHAG